MCNLTDKTCLIKMNVSQYRNTYKKKPKIYIIFIIFDQYTLENGPQAEKNDNKRPRT